MHDIAQMLLMAAGGQGGQVSRTVGGHAEADITPASSYTTSALSIGAADAGRFVVVALTARNSTGGTEPTTAAVTIGGVAATQIARYGVASGFETALWGAVVPTGTTAAVAATLDRNIDTYAVAALAVYGAINTPSAYTVTGVPSGGGAITGVRNGLVICATAQIGAYYNTGVVTVDSNFYTGAPNYTGVQVATALPTTTASISPLNSGSGGMPYVAASFAPT